MPSVFLLAQISYLRIFWCKDNISVFGDCTSLLVTAQRDLLGNTWKLSLFLCWDRKTPIISKWKHLRGYLTSSPCDSSVPFSLPCWFPSLFSLWCTLGSISGNDPALLCRIQLFSRRQRPHSRKRRKSSLDALPVTVETIKGPALRVIVPYCRQTSSLTLRMISESIKISCQKSLHVQS